MTTDLLDPIFNNTADHFRIFILLIPRPVRTQRTSRFLQPLIRLDLKSKTRILIKSMSSRVIFKIAQKKQTRSTQVHHKKKSTLLKAKGRTYMHHQKHSSGRERKRERYDDDD